MSDQSKTLEALHVKVDGIEVALARIEGKFEGEARSNGDWWTRLIAIGAMLLAYFK